MDITRKHVIHAVIVLAVIWLGSILFPQFYHFTNAGAVFLVAAAYMAVYFAFNLLYGRIATKLNTVIDGWLFFVFMIIDFIPGAIALYLMAILYPGFWACIPWLIAVILSVICELIHMAGAFIQER